MDGPILHCHRIWCRLWRKCFSCVKKGRRLRLHISVFGLMLMPSGCHMYSVVLVVVIVVIVVVVGDVQSDLGAIADRCASNTT